MDTLLSLAPYLLVLLCPAAMFIGMRYMMKGMCGEQNMMNTPPPHNEMSDGGATVEPIDAWSRHA